MLPFQFASISPLDMWYIIDNFSSIIQHSNYKNWKIGQLTKQLHVHPLQCSPQKTSTPINSSMYDLGQFILSSEQAELGWIAWCETPSTVWIDQRSKGSINDHKQVIGICDLKLWSKNLRKIFVVAAIIVSYLVNETYSL